MVWIARDGVVLPVIVRGVDQWLTVPSAFTPSTVTFMPAPAATTVKVALLGAVPAAKVHFARFSFQVPTLRVAGLSESSACEREHQPK